MAEENVIVDKTKFTEELLSHPFFMTEAPSDGAEVHPCYEALQQLKFNDEINSPEELAQANKEEGNQKFKKKLYKYAIQCYTDGLAHKCSNETLNAELYSNRATANFYLGNYGSAIKDLKQAKNLKSNYLKAIVKGAQCFQKLDKLEECLTWCKEGLEIEPDNKTLLKLVEDAEEKLRKKKEKEREEAQKEEETRKLMDSIKERGIAFTGPLMPTHTLAEGKMVSLDENGYLEWPVIFHFIDCGSSYLIPNFNEYSIFSDHILLMLESRHTIAEWIPESYTPSNVVVSFKRRDSGELVEIDQRQMLSTILKDKLYLIEDGLPAFCIASRIC